jgi:hypothetical protein
MVDELPLVVGGAMRGAFDLALITPEANQPNDDNFNVGGGQGGGYGATLDGVSVLTGRFNSVQWTNVNTPSVDAITEFAVETNGFKAEYGRAQGGIITFSSKSGSNEFHGTVYEFLRNDALDSRRFFEASKAKLRQNDFSMVEVRQRSRLMTGGLRPTTIRTGKAAIGSSNLPPSSGRSRTIAPATPHDIIRRPARRGI